MAATNSKPGYTHRSHEKSNVFKLTSSKFVKLVKFASVGYCSAKFKFIFPTVFQKKVFYRPIKLYHLIPKFSKPHLTKM